MAAGYPVKTVLRICKVPRSTYYYRLQHPTITPATRGGRPVPGYSWNHRGEKISDARIKSYIRHLLSQEEESCYGYRKLTLCLRRQYKLRINKKKVYRLCKLLGVLQPQREVKNSVPRKVANNRVVTGPNQLWQMDIKYGYVTGLRRHFYLASIIDVYDRGIVTHFRGKSCDTKAILQLVQKALLKRNVHVDEHRLVIRTDNGPQFCSHAFHAFSNEMGFEHERTPNRTPNKNAYIESFHSVLERECYQRNVFETYEQAFAVVDRYIRFYNERRIHGSLQDLSPAEYLSKHLNGLIKPREIAL
ncbi:IS3 family transposase [Cohnella cholangitidis]|uniref:IS3 family transposase n=1 Tax=Cohnella cholangitidis TaxID=2598458 RepID=A0A7G5C7E3_9BACL|nr:IS3 family transposase [Cohnella cholangitidis]